MGLQQFTIQQRTARFHFESGQRGFDPRERVLESILVARRCHSARRGAEGLEVLKGRSDE